MKIIYKDGTVAECPQEEELHVLRHTAAHIMAPVSYTHLRGILQKHNELIAQRRQDGANGLRDDEFIMLLKDSSLITVIGGKELLYAAQGIMNRTYEPDVYKRQIL